MFAIGVDGGGTKTIGAISDADGRIRAEVSRGPSNYHEVGEETTSKVLSEVVQVLLSRVNGRRSQVTGICLGLAGIGRNEDEEVIRKAAEPLGLACDPLIVSDARIALVGGTLGESGIVVISGTGSIVVGKKEEGDLVRVGGHGPLLSDEGSGYQLGRAALRAVMRAHDGRVEATPMTDLILGTLGLKSPQDLVPWARTSGKDKSQVAALGPIVLQASEDGDRTAVLIVKAAAADLAVMVRTVYRRVGFDSELTEVVLTGGLLDHSEYFFDELKRAVLQAVSEVEVMKPRMPPVAGALLYALAQSGNSVTGLTLANMMRTWKSLHAHSEE